MTAQTVDHRLLTVAEYLALPEDDDTRFELQEGALVMMSPPSPDHQDGGSLLRDQLLPQLPDLKILKDVGIDLQLAPPDQPGTARIPDIVVVRREAFKRVRAERGLLQASEVLLAVEFISPTSVRMDTRIKRAEYADAGIGHYWVIDLNDGPSLVACHLAGAFGYTDVGPVRGTFTATEPFPVTIDLDALIDRD